MSGKPASVGKREVDAIIKAARQQGATRVELRWDNASAIIHLADSNDAPIAADANEWLEDDDAH
jgi:hypothetical protein